VHRQSKGMLISDADLFVFCSHIGPGPSCKLGLSEGMEQPKHSTSIAVWNV
jgi:hypothetical protein